MSEELSESLLSPLWKKPDEIMAMHRLKMKKRALQARMRRTDNEPRSTESTTNPTISSPGKRRNPFARNSDTKKLKHDPVPSSPANDLDVSADNTLFKLLSIGKSQSNHLISIENIPKNLPNITQTVTNLTRSNPQLLTPPSCKFIPIDWTVKRKMRMISEKPFKWTSKLRTSQEASGITGFVRCLDTTKSESLDTSLSARCHQCCLLWQHPSLPWLSLFPRTGPGKNILNSGPNPLASNSEITKALLTDWVESFRSLFQLVRARQCPFFYICGNSFTALFRAAGICGFSETHAFLTPTTRGFRQTLRQEDIEYTMPLKKSNRSSNDGSEDQGYETLDSNISKSPEFNVNRRAEVIETTEEIGDGLLDEEDEEDWLRSLGVDANEIKKISDVDTRKKTAMECSIDNSEQSLICVEGVEAQALFNFLLNCKRLVPVLGPLAGVPPTLYAPVAFRGATLASLKVRENKVVVNNSEYYSMEVQGPILPHTVQSLNDLFSNNLDEYSVSFANLDNTSGFSKVHAQLLNKKIDEEDTATVFGQENLSDCGLHDQILKHFCAKDSNRVQNYETLKYVGADQTYSWT